MAYGVELAVILLVVILDTCHSRTVVQFIGATPVLLPCIADLKQEEFSTQFYLYQVAWEKEDLGKIYIQFGHHNWPDVRSQYQGRLRFIRHSVLNYSLEISQPTMHEEGLYTCHLVFRNDKTAEVRTTYFKVQLKIWQKPRFKTPPVELTILKSEGDYATLICPLFTGNPWPKIQWERNGELIVNGGRIVVRNAEMDLYGLRSSDSGFYACKLSNRFGEAKRLFKLILSGAFFIYSHPGNATVLEGSTAHFNCGHYVTPGGGNPAVTWYYNDKTINRSELLRATSFVSQNGTLVIPHASRSHAGNYRCKVTMKDHNHKETVRTSWTGSLEILFPPTFHQNASLTKYLPLGKASRITCPIAANPPVIMTQWQRDGIGLGTLNEGKNFSLQHVTSSHAGSYQCRARNDKSSPWSGWSPKFQVKVVIPPKFLASPQPLYQAMAGDTLTMPCAHNHGHNFPVSLSWLKDGKRLRVHTHRIWMKLNSKLVIYNLRKTDTGTYQCKVVNPVLSMVTQTKVIVENTTPHEPYNLTVTSVSYFYVELTWNPSYDGGLTQLYEVWYRQVDITKWYLQQVATTDGTSTQLEKLYPDTAYCIVVMSKDSFGEGMFSNKVNVRTKGYTPNVQMPSVLPKDRNGNTYYPHILRNLGPVPSAPQFLVFDMSASGMIRLKWESPNESNINIIYYRVEYSYDLAKWKTLKPTFKLISLITGQDIDPLPLADALHFAVRAYGLLARSPQSNRVSVMSEQLKLLLLSQYYKKSVGSMAWVVAGFMTLIIAAISIALIVLTRRRNKKLEKIRKRLSPTCTASLQNFQKTTDSLLPRIIDEKQDLHVLSSLSWLGIDDSIVKSLSSQQSSRQIYTSYQPFDKVDSLNSSSSTSTSNSNACLVRFPDPNKQTDMSWYNRGFGDGAHKMTPMSRLNYSSPANTDCTTLHISDVSTITKSTSASSAVSAVPQTADTHVTQKKNAFCTEYTKYVEPSAHEHVLKVLKRHRGGMTRSQSDPESGFSVNLAKFALRRDSYEDLTLSDIEYQHYDDPGFKRQPITVYLANQRRINELRRDLQLPDGMSIECYRESDLL